MNPLLQFGSEVSFKLWRNFLIIHVHVGAAFDFSMPIGGNASVLTRVRLGHLFDLQLGFLTFLLNGNAAAVRELPPFSFHPFHTGDGVPTHLGNEGGSSLCGRPRGQLEQELHMFKVFTPCSGSYSL